jgi:hypothetical protein
MAPLCRRLDWHGSAKEAALRVTPNKPQAGTCSVHFYQIIESMQIAKSVFLTIRRYFGAWPMRA